jgi:plastocyanin
MLNNILEGISRRATGLAVGVMMATLATGLAPAAEWQARVGAQSPDLFRTSLVYLPNEFWIHSGDTIRFAFETEELHTVSFLKPGQVRPPGFSIFGLDGGVFVGCPGTTPDGSIVDNSACVSSDILTAGQSYTVTFPSAGNFKLVCLVHSRMTGAIHVLPSSDPLPHDQSFYDRLGDAQRSSLLSEAAAIDGRGHAQNGEASGNVVVAGLSSIHSTGGGSQTVAVMRFYREFTLVHVGDTVEWVNMSTPVFHTVTFGTEPLNDMPPSAGVTLDADGVRHAVISSANDNVNSGFIGVPNQETAGQPEAPLDITRFRVTFTAPGVFKYICGLHDNLGMKGTVIVRE